MSRPTKLTPQLQDKIVQAVKAGNYAQIAAQYAGIGTTTFFRWMQQGAEEEKGIYREFREAIKVAEAEAEVRAVAIIQRQMPESWQAAMTYLERKHPDRWKRRDELDIKRLPTDQLLELAAAVEGRIESAGDRAALEAGAAE